MEVAAVIISTFSLILSVVCIVLMLAKNFFSTHVIQREMVDPFAAFSEKPSKNNLLDPFRELGDPIEQDELDQMELARQKKGKMS